MVLFSIRNTSKDDRVLINVLRYAQRLLKMLFRKEFGLDKGGVTIFHGWFKIQINYEVMLRMK